MKADKELTAKEIKDKILHLWGEHVAGLTAYEIKLVDDLIKQVCKEQREKDKEELMQLIEIVTDEDVFIDYDTIEKIVNNYFDNAPEPEI